MVSQNKLFFVVDKFVDEYLDARSRFGSFNTYHEGIAIIREEFEELWDEIKGEQREERMRKEAIQLGAMVLSFIVELSKMEGDDEAYAGQRED